MALFSAEVMPAVPGSEGLRGRMFAFLDRSFDWLVGVLIGVTILLPSGSIYGLNLKAPVYAVLLPLAAFIFFYRGQATSERISLLIGVPAIFAGWLILGVADEFPFAGALRQYMDFQMVFLICWLAQLFCLSNQTRQMRFLKIVVFSELATSFLKVGILAYAVARGIPTVEIIAGLSRAFGVNLMTMDLGAMFGRIQFVSDALIPICIFIVLRHRDVMGFGHLRAALMVLVLLVSVIFSFSRYFWVFAAIAFILGLVTGRRDRFQLLLSGLLLATILASLPALTLLYELRFSADVAGSSDLIRTEQTAALNIFFKEAPLFGHGLGSYTTQVVRDEDTSGGIRYGYEAQILALSGQIGLVGLSLLAILGAFYFSDLWWQPQSSVPDRLALISLLLTWLLAGVYNPLLFHPIAGIIYASLAALAAVAQRETSGQRLNIAKVIDLGARGPQQYPG